MGRGERRECVLLLHVRGPMRFAVSGRVAQLGFFCILNFLIVSYTDRGRGGVCLGE